MDPIEISREEYASLTKRPSEEEFAAQKKRADDAEADLAEANKKVEAAETAQKKAEGEKDEAEKKVKEAEDEKAEVALRDERFGKLGDGFLAKLGDTTKDNLRTDAGKLDEEAWEKRVAEVEELAEVKRDTKLKGGKGGEKPAEKPNGESSEDDEFSFEEIASSSVSGGGDEDAAPTGGERASIARGLVSGPSTKSD